MADREIIRPPFRGSFPGVLDDGFIFFQQIAQYMNSTAQRATDLEAIEATDTVTAETSFGLTADAGMDDDFSRGDHTHGTPASPIPGHVADTDHPSAGEKEALAGTSGTPSSINKYVTDADARNTNDRTPTAHDNGKHSETYITAAALADYQPVSEKDAGSGYAGLNAASRTTKGVDAADDIVIDLATKGIVFKDTQATPHYWRMTVDNTGTAVITDLSTSKP